MEDTTYLDIPPNDVIKVTADSSSMAIDSILKSAEEGNLESQYQLAMIYILGEEVPQNFAEAEKWLRTASGKGHLPSKRELGILIASGSVKSGAETEAYDLLRSPVDRMDPRSIYYLAFMYETGRGVERSIVDAIRLYGTAANLGYPGAYEDYTRLNEIYTEERRATLRSMPLLNLQISEEGIEAACCKDMLDFVLNEDIYFMDTYKGPAIAARNEKGEDVVLEKCPFCNTEVIIVHKKSKS